MVRSGGGERGVVWREENEPIIQTRARSSVTRHGDDKARSRQTVRLLWIRDNKFIIVLRTESDYKRSLHHTIHILILGR